MVRRALIGLTALVGVASAQPVPNATWSLSSPRTTPTVEWSPSGSFVALSTNSAVEVFDSHFNLKWSRAISGAQPSFLSYYNHPDRIHFSGDSASVYIRTSSGNYSQFNVATGALIRSHNFSDWTGDYLLMPVTSPSVPSMLVAVQVSVDGGGTETYNLRAYDESTLALVTSTTLTHPYVSGVDFPVGRYRNRLGAAFYNKLVNPHDGTVVTYNNVGGGAEAWTLGIDPDFGAVQSIQSLTGGTYAAIGSRRIDGFGALTWSNSSTTVPSVLSFAKTTVPSTLGLAPTGTGVWELNYLTGDATTVSASGVSSFTFGSGNANPKDGVKGSADAVRQHRHDSDAVLPREGLDLLVVRVLLEVVILKIERLAVRRQVQPGRDDVGEMAPVGP